MKQRSFVFVSCLNVKSHLVVPKHLLIQGLTVGHISFEEEWK